MQDLYTENCKVLIAVKKTKEDEKEEICHIHGLEELLGC